jgi:hypothetical protein
MNVSTRQGRPFATLERTRWEDLSKAETDDRGSEIVVCFPAKDYSGKDLDEKS